ncbi:hypothetical protein C0389_00805 [bacterium]|nr:hypothetical protein [bacterium]
MSVSLLSVTEKIIRVPMVLEFYKTVTKTSLQKLSFQFLKLSHFQSDDPKCNISVREKISIKYYKN